MATIDFTVDKGNAWKVELYGGRPYVTMNIDILQTHVALPDREPIRWNYWILIAVYPTDKGVNRAGDRACGSAQPAVLSARPEPRNVYPLVSIGDTLLTPFGVYIVNWASKTDHDNLKLTEVK